MLSPNRIDQPLLALPFHGRSGEIAASDSFGIAFRNFFPGTSFGSTYPSHLPPRGIQLVVECCGPLKNHLFLFAPFGFPSSFLSSSSSPPLFSVLQRTSSSSLCVCGCARCGDNKDFPSFRFRSLRKPSRCGVGKLNISGASFMRDGKRNRSGVKGRRPADVRSVKKRGNLISVDNDARSEVKRDGKELQKIGSKGKV